MGMTMNLKLALLKATVPKSVPKVLHRRRPGQWPKLQQTRRYPGLDVTVVTVQASNQRLVRMSLKAIESVTGRHAAGLLRLVRTKLQA